MFAYLGPRSALGVFPQHWWSVGRDGQRHDANRTEIQYFVFCAPPWDPEARRRIGTMIQIGKSPVHIRAEADHAVLRPDDRPGTRLDFRAHFIPVIRTFMF